MTKIAFLVFADDIVLLATSPSELQTMINKVSDGVNAGDYSPTQQHLM